MVYSSQSVVEKSMVGKEQDRYPRQERANPQHAIPTIYMYEDSSPPGPLHLGRDLT